jgi:hypothetical protein
LLEIEDDQGMVAAFFLAWSHAHAIADPSAEPRARVVAQVLEGFDPSAGPKPQLIAEAEDVLSRSVAACKAHLEEAGEDPYSPL